jgi:mRNA interferase MazF
MNKGDVILIPFPFTDLTGSKLRPVVVLISSDFDLTVAFITTQMKWRDTTDVELLPSTESGIKKVSLIRLSKIATVDKSLAIGKIGELLTIQQTEVNLKLKQLFKLV